MPWKQDQPGCECCGCGRVEDDFSTDTISNYSQMSGTWSISDGQLSTSSANAVLKAVTTGLLYQQLATRFKSPDRKTVNLLGGMSSGTVYLYAQVEFGEYDGDTCGWLEIRNKTATDDSRIGERRRLDNLDPDQWHNLTLCIQPKEDVSEAAIYATLNGACLYAELEQTPSVGAGLGTGSGSDAVYFDSFTWSDSKSPDNECPECDCPCESSFDDFEGLEDSGFPIGGSGSAYGCLWEVCSNSWVLSNGFFVGSGDANTQHLVPIDARSKEQYASVLCRGQQGTKALLYLGYECGTSSMCGVIEFWDAPGKSKLAISNDNGATYYNNWRYIDTTGISVGPGMGQVTPGFNIRGEGMTKLEVCLRNNKFYASAAGERVSAGDSSAGSALFAGLGVRYHLNGSPETGRSYPVWFDDFQSGKSGQPCGSCDQVDSGGGSDCSHCVDGTSPASMLLTYPTLSGSCGTCGEGGGNYLLSSRGQLSCCRWGSVGFCGCAATSAGGTLTLCHDDSDGYYLEYTQSCNWFSSSVEEHTWKKILGSDKPDCSTINETLTLQSTSGGCSATGTTVTVRAV